MSQRPRPYIPISVRVEVAARQAVEHGARLGWVELVQQELSVPEQSRLSVLLSRIFGAAAQVNLDHDPPLRQRRFDHDKAEDIMNAYAGMRLTSAEKNRQLAACYQPNANDPRYLVYRLADDHKVKTNVRGEHGQYPDRVLIKRARKLEKRKVDTSDIPEVKPAWFKKAKLQTPKGYRWPKRPFPKGRGFPKRSKRNHG